jgi:hypothetical protein
VILFLYVNKYNALVFLVTLLWGFQDSSVNTHVSEILGFEFETNVEPYSVFNLVQSATVFVFLSIEAYIKSHMQYYAYNIIIGILGLFMCGATLNFKFKRDVELENKKNEHEGSIVIVAKR